MFIPNSSPFKLKILEVISSLAKVVTDLFDGVETDLEEKVQINSKKEMLVYSYRVAGTVGLMMSKILKVKNKEALKGAIDLGIAMQLTNIARDVCEDRDRNRQYIKPEFSVIKETINDSLIFYEKSFNSISSIPLRSRFSVIVARRVYKKIGDYIPDTLTIAQENEIGQQLENKFALSLMNSVFGNVFRPGESVYGTKKDK